jgi:transcription initiation factor IIE alpha subunit
MEYYVALKVKEAWGDKPCDHPHLEKEYYSGAFLVTWVCTRCGQEFTIAQKLEMYQTRKRKLKNFSS